MESLLRGLTEPTIKADGTLRPPNATMMRAARTIQELAKLEQANREILLVKNAECERAHQYGIEYMLRYEALKAPLDISEYQEAMNKDRE